LAESRRQTALSADRRSAFDLAAGKKRGFCRQNAATMRGDGVLEEAAFFAGP